MNDGKYRIKLLVIDIIERLGVYSYVKIMREQDKLFYGMYQQVPKELLNETVVKIRSLDCTDVPLLIEIE